MLGVLIALGQFYDTRVIQFPEQLSLHECLVFFGLFGEFFLLDALDGVEFPSFLSQRYHAIGPLPDGAQHLVIRLVLARSLF